MEHQQLNTKYKFTTARINGISTTKHKFMIKYIAKVDKRCLCELLLHDEGQLKINSTITLKQNEFE